jgi:L-aminopeptidase/D-esterase-like protein
MNGAITDVPGILVGQAENPAAGTGCTIILCTQGAVAGVDVRGGAPGTRETDCLDPSNVVPCAHAVYLGGGSSFGLHGVDGVMQYLEENKVGFNVLVTTVPIVPAAVIFDLLVGDPMVRPDPAMARRACETAGKTVAQGNVGAGTGATVGKGAGRSRVMKGGLGTASVRVGDLVVGAIVAVNCFGDVRDVETGEVLAGALNASGDGFEPLLSLFLAGTQPADPFSGNTTIGVVATNAALDKAQARRVAMMAHDGFARAIEPIHTMHDGDTIFALSTGSVAADLSIVGALAAHAMAGAIANGVRHATSAYGVPGHADVKRRARAKL